MKQHRGPKTKEDVKKILEIFLKVINMYYLKNSPTIFVSDFHQADLMRVRVNVAQ